MLMSHGRRCRRGAIQCRNVDHLTGIQQLLRSRGPFVLQSNTSAARGRPECGSVKRDMESSLLIVIWSAREPCLEKNVGLGSANRIVQVAREEKECRAKGSKMQQLIKLRTVEKRGLCALLCFQAGSSLAS